jgi:hypothetical protein
MTVIVDFPGLFGFSGFFSLFGCKHEKPNQPNKPDKPTYSILPGKTQSLTVLSLIAFVRKIMV